MIKESSPTRPRVPCQLGMDRCGTTLEKSGVPVDKRLQLGGHNDRMSGLQMALFSVPAKVLSNLKSVTYIMSAITYPKPTITLMRRQSFMLPAIQTGMLYP